MQSHHFRKEPIEEVKAQEGDILMTQETEKRLLISDLGWSEAEAQEIYYRLLPLQEDWEALGMEVYDKL